jgi:hypothetical protein
VPLFGSFPETASLIARCLAICKVEVESRLDHLPQDRY